MPNFITSRYRVRKSLISSDSQRIPLLFESYAEREKFLVEHFRGHRPQPQRFYAAQANDKTALEDSAERAIAKVLPPQHDRTIDLCMFAALDAGMASERLHAGDVPWTTVAITSRGEPTELGWHGQKPTENEARALRSAKRRDAQWHTATGT